MVKEKKQLNLLIDVELYFKIKEYAARNHLNTTTFATLAFLKMINEEEK